MSEEKPGEAPAPQTTVATNTLLQIRNLLSIGRQAAFNIQGVMLAATAAGVDVSWNGVDKLSDADMFTGVINAAEDALNKILGLPLEGQVNDPDPDIPF